MVYVEICWSGKQSERVIEVIHVTCRHVEFNFVMSTTNKALIQHAKTYQWHDLMMLKGFQIDRTFIMRQGNKLSKLYI